MTIVKCKECSKEVSTKANKCPHCGAKVTKPIGLLGYIFLGLFSFVFFNMVVSTDNDNYEPDPYPGSNANINVTQKAKPKIKPVWSVKTKKDEMAGNIEAYATSISVGPKSKMEFPYHDISSSMGVGCDGSSEWAYFMFSSQPNLIGDVAEDGYSTLVTKIKWDESILRTKLIQKWGGDALHFSNGQSAINLISGSNKVLLELDWFGEGRVYFEYSLKGSSDAINKMRTKCGRPE